VTAVAVLLAACLLFGVLAVRNIQGTRQGQRLQLGVCWLLVAALFAATITVIALVASEMPHGLAR